MIRGVGHVGYGALMLMGIIETAHDVLIMLFIVVARWIPSVSANLHTLLKGRSSNVMDAVLKPTTNDLHAANPRQQRGPRVVSSTAVRNVERGRGSLSLGIDDERQAAGGVSYVVEFPGGPSCPPPRPARLVGAAAQAAAQRNVGTMSSVLNADENRDYQSARPQPKLRSTAAQVNATRYSGASTACCLNYDRNSGYSSARGPCVRGAVGREALERSRGVMDSIIKVDANVGYVSPPPARRRQPAGVELSNSSAAVRHALDVAGNAGYQTSRRPASRAVTAEARENAARFNGQEVSELITTTDAETMPPPEPRVRPEARDAAMRSRGSCGLVMDGQLENVPVRDVRVKGSGKDNYERGRQGSVNQLMSGSGQLEQLERPVSRARDDGVEISQYGQSGSVHKLFASYGQLPQSARPAARVKPEAGQNAVRNMGTMSDYL